MDCCVNKLSRVLRRSRSGARYIIEHARATKKLVLVLRAVSFSLALINDDLGRINRQVLGARSGGEIVKALSGQNVTVAVVRRRCNRRDCEALPRHLDRRSARGSRADQTRRIGRRSLPSR